MSGSSGLSGRYAKALYELAAEKKIICYIPPRKMSVGILKEANPASKIAFWQPKKMRVRHDSKLFF